MRPSKETTPTIDSHGNESQGFYNPSGRVDGLRHCGRKFEPSRVFSHMRVFVASKHNTKGSMRYRVSFAAIGMCMRIHLLLTSVPEFRDTVDECLGETTSCAILDVGKKNQREPTARNSDKLLVSGNPKKCAASVPQRSVFWETSNMMCGMHT